MKRIIILALACSASLAILAKGDGESRSTKVNVEISASDEIRIQAKYTALTIETWNKNEVEIEATVRYDGKVTSKIQEFLDEFESRVNDNIRLSGGELFIDTDLDLPNKVQVGSKNVGINISYGDELKIFYKIKSPGSNEYTISTSYEDVRLIGAFNKVDFTQYSGDLTAGSIKSGKMNLKYGSAEIEHLGTAEMEIYEQEISVTSIIDITINMKYSDVEFRSVEVMEAISYESDIKIGKAIVLSGNYKYGDINITNSLDKAELTLYEVDIEAGTIGSLLLENTKYSKFEIDRVGSITFRQSYEDETVIGTVGSFKSTNSKYGNHTIDLLESSFKLNAYEDEVEINELAKSVTDIIVDGKYIELSIDSDGSSFILKSNVKYGNVEYNENLVDVKRYIKEGDNLEVEAVSKNTSDQPINILVTGYEVKVQLD
ncbi:hypothetical protein [Ekhidna sp.]|uniref:hypothetical protein n=1 Tax=Ekhidna sp. TaxID=2608089 RepID=UPI003BAC3F0C